MLSRFKSAARILLKGDAKKKKRNPIPSITAEEVAEIKQFFPAKSSLSSVMPARGQLF